MVCQLTQNAQNDPKYSAEIVQYLCNGNCEICIFFVNNLTKREQLIISIKNELSDILALLNDKDNDLKLSYKFRRIFKELNLLA